MCLFFFLTCSSSFWMPCGSFWVPSCDLVLIWVQWLRSLFYQSGCACVESFGNCLNALLEWLRKGSNRPVGAWYGLGWPWVACCGFYGLVARLKPSLKPVGSLRWLVDSFLLVITEFFSMACQNGLIISLKDECPSPVPKNQLVRTTKRSGLVPSPFLPTWIECNEIHSRNYLPNQLSV
jgi:hypothetical protein